METIDISSATDNSVFTKSVANSTRRRSSIFCPTEDCDVDAVEDKYPLEYKEKLKTEQEKWNQMLSLSRSEYKKQKKRLPIVKIDKTVLNKQQQDFLNQGPSCQEYKKVAEEFSNKFQLCSAVYALQSRSKQIEKESLLHKVSYFETMLLEKLNEKLNV